MITCPTCKGSKVVSRAGGIELAYGVIDTVAGLVDCWDCDGTGTLHPSATSQALLDAAVDEAHEQGANKYGDLPMHPGDRPSRESPQFIALADHIAQLEYDLRHAI